MYKLYSLLAYAGTRLDRLGGAMPHGRTIFLADETYHLYNRGVDRAAIFFTRDNYLYFMRLLEAKASRDSIRIVAFCLMPNHFHILVSPDGDHVVSRFIGSVLGAYAQGLNVARKRVGPLFQGRTKSIHVSRDDYLAHVARYIHLNPVAAGLVARPQDWPYSNYGKILSGRVGSGPDGVLIGGIFPDGAACQRFVEAPQSVELPASLKLAGS
jgi:REP element-mobilizing transposase RayT